MLPPARVVAFYLPQFHPVPENDEWWGAGFTEWTNVVRGRRYYPFQYQPQLPADLGFYDLRVPETRAKQAELARKAGVEAFCYWHYWFGGGKRVLERPFGEVLESGRPDFPFCLGWANQSWTGVWHGAPHRLLIEQTYPGPDDERRHFEEVLPAFRDPRYLTVNGRPLFYVYSPLELPDPAGFAAHWRELAAQAGLPGIYLVSESPPEWDHLAAGFDAHVHIPWADFVAARPWWQKVYDRLLRQPRRVTYQTLTEHLVPSGAAFPPDRHPCLFPNWDNTPRSGRRGVVVSGSTPDRFADQVRRAVAHVADRPPEERLVFVKSWNEWAEGNHLEPDQRFGHGYLHAIQEGMATTGSNAAQRKVGSSSR